MITTRGRAALSADPEGKDFSNWGPKPPSQMCWSDDASKVTEQTTFSFKDAEEGREISFWRL